MKCPVDKFITYDTLFPMPTEHPRANIVLEAPLHDLVKKLAKRDGVSVSMKLRDLVKDALELTEDTYWDKLASERRDSFNAKSAKSHKDVWE